MIDDRLAAVAIGVGEVAAAQARDAHRGEVAGTRQAEVRMRQLLRVMLHRPLAFEHVAAVRAVLAGRQSHRAGDRHDARQLPDALEQLGCRTAVTRR